MNYPDTKTVVEIRARARFEQKRAGGWRGWHRANLNQNMLDRAVAKMRKLAKGGCADPVKEAADVMNFAIFMAAQQLKPGEG